MENNAKFYCLICGHAVDDYRFIENERGLMHMRCYWLKVDEEREKNAPTPAQGETESEA